MQMDKDFSFQVPGLQNRDGELWIRLHEGKPEWQLESDSHGFAGWEPCPKPIFDAIVSEYEHLINPPPPPEPTLETWFFTFVTERRVNLVGYDTVFYSFDDIYQTFVVRVLTSDPNEEMRNVKGQIYDQKAKLLFQAMGHGSIATCPEHYLGYYNLVQWRRYYTI